MLDSEITKNFIYEIIDKDLKSGKNEGRVHTRFPPEPNGYLHIGHAKSICLNFGIANDFQGGKCNLRFDDTNPTKEDAKYVNSIIEDVKWLEFNYEDRLYYASDYFQKFYEYALKLIKAGKAYVDDQNADEIRNNRGTLIKPGIQSIYRDRNIEENILLFTDMKNGKFGNGKKVLRAKINMSHSNINMRDPVLYRILHENHHRTKSDWCIYPMYDWAHGLEDSIEGITHSICTLEFEDHRPLYNWFLEQLNIFRPQQIEFARLNLNYTIMSKRKLKLLVDKNYVSGWDDPRMPTISGLRRRGYTAQSIRNFANKIGVAKRDGIIDIALLNHCVREDLNKKAIRVMAILNPIKLIITNYSNDFEALDVDNNPEDDSLGTRKVLFGRELYIERDDFLEEPPKKYFRLGPGREIRLKHAYYVTCTGFKKDEDGNIIEVECTYDPKTRGGWSEDGRKVRGTIQWVSVKHAVNTEVRIYNNLFNNENPEEGKKDFLENLNNNSIEIIDNAKIEPGLDKIYNQQPFQFLRIGYFYLDKDSTLEKPIFNRTVGLRDSWSKKNI